jgi:hypothetical protein
MDDPPRRLAAETFLPAQGGKSPAWTIEDLLPAKQAMMATTLCYQGLAASSWPASRGVSADLRTGSIRSPQRRVHLPRLGEEEESSVPRRSYELPVGVVKLFRARNGMTALESILFSNGSRAGASSGYRRFRVPAFSACSPGT